MPPLPSLNLYNQNEDAFWAALRNQFLIPKDEVYLNNGTVGSSPYPVLKAIFDAFLESEQMAQTDPENYPIWGYDAYAPYRDSLAKFIGATRDQIALTRNATESNSYIANGLDMKAGDEVFIYTQQAKFTYTVKNKRVVEPTEVSVLQPTTESTLTLITCYPYLVDTQRLVVFAQLSN